MTQVEYDIIVECIRKGVPALSENLIVSLNKLVVASNNTQQEKAVVEEKKPESVAKKTIKKEKK